MLFEPLADKNAESIPYLLRRILEVRTVLEDLSTEALEGFPCLLAAYGQLSFKCPWIKCARFCNGFASRAQRDRHLKVHQRAYQCTVAGCDYAIIGFPTSSELSRHERLEHCKTYENLGYPNVRKRSIVESLNTAIDADDAAAVRELYVETLMPPSMREPQVSRTKGEIEFLQRAIRRGCFHAAFVLWDLSVIKDPTREDGELLNTEERTDILGKLMNAAANAGHVKLLDAFLKTGVDVNIEYLKETPIASALSHGNFDAVRFLFSCKDIKLEPPNQACKRRYGEGFVKASSAGHNDIVRVILGTLQENLGNLSNLVSDALAKAASHEHETTVRLIQQMSRDVGLDKSSSCPKPLKLALSNNRSTAMKDLVKLQVDINGKSMSNALAKAAAKGDMATVMEILRAGANINHASKSDSSAIYAASKSGQLAMVQFLIDKGAEVNVENGHFGNALQAAALSRRKDATRIVRTLLEHGADLNVQGGEYGTALQAAASRNSPKLVQILLDNGADVNTEGEKYMTALQAAASNNNPKMVQILLDNGANVNAQMEEVGTALHVAASKNSSKLVQILLDNGANVNAQKGKHETALQVAAWHNDIESVQILLDNGADVNLQGGRYGTPLHVAASNKSPELVQILLDNGADVNIRGGAYRSALTVASMSKPEAPQLVQMLLDKGADVNAAHALYGSVLQAATRAGNHEVAHILRSHGAVD